MPRPHALSVILRSVPGFLLAAALTPPVIGGGCHRGGGAGAPTGPWELSTAVGRITLPAKSTLSIARLAPSGAPDNCADVTWEGPHEVDTDRLRARGFVVLKGTCPQTFAKLSALATCTRAEAEDGSHPLGHGFASYYDLATLATDDTYRGQCQGTSGDWKLSPDFEAQRAKAGALPPHHEIDSLFELLP